MCQNPNTTAWYQSSKLNLGPRLAFSWSPERFKNKTVLRIGAGYYYGPGQTEDQVQPIDSDRASRSITSGALLAFPVIPSQILSGFDVNNLSGFQPRAYPSDEYKLPEKILSFTGSVQQNLPGNAVLTVAYVGSQGRNLFLRSWTNRIVGVTTNPATGAGAAVLQYGSRFAQIDYKTSGGTDSYNSMQTTLNRRFAKGMTAGLQWTYSHSLGNTGGSNEAQTTQNPFNFGQDRGNNAFDVRHSMNASVLYALPNKFRNKAMRGVVGGWELGGIFNARTGLPIDVTMTRPDILYRVNSTGQIINNPYCTLSGAPVVCSSAAAGKVVETTAVINNPYGGAFRNNRRPAVIAGIDPFLSTGDRRFILNPAAFTTPAAGSFGNLGRFPLHGPGLTQLDFTLHKRFDLPERLNLEFRAELYNIFNRANFSNPPAVLPNGLPSVGANGAIGTGIQPGQPMSTSSGLGSFGVVQGTVSKDVGLGAQRQAQFSLRLNF